MAVAIRLSRGGAKKRPYYRIVVADSRASRDGKYLEQIGTYNPLLAKDDENRVKIDADRAKHWLSVGAQPSDRVARFLDAAGVKERAARNPATGAPATVSARKVVLFSASPLMKKALNQDAPARPRKRSKSSK